MIHSLPKSLIETATKILTESSSSIDVDGVMKSRVNYDDQPIHHTDEGIRNFHRWFGDSTHQQITPGPPHMQGLPKPMVMYHETIKENADKIKKHGFDTSIVGNRDFDEQMPNGVFLKHHNVHIGVVTNKDDAVQIPVYVKSHNTLYLSDRDELHNYLMTDKEYKNAKNKHDDFNNVNSDISDTMFNKYSDIEGLKASYGVTSREDAHRLHGEAMDKHLKEWSAGGSENAAECRAAATNKLLKDGYDSLAVSHDTGTRGREVQTHVILNPENIKGVENSGDFSSKTKSLHESFHPSKSLIDSATDHCMGIRSGPPKKVLGIDMDIHIRGGAYKFNPDRSILLEAIGDWFKAADRNNPHMFQNLSDSHYLNLSDDEKQSVRAYTYNSDPIKDHLRSGNKGNTVKIDDGIYANIDHIDSALKKNKLTDDLITYSGLRKSPLEDNMSYGHMHSATHISSSTDPIVAYNFAGSYGNEISHIARIHNKKGSDGLYIGHNKELTHTPLEFEYMIPRNTSFRVGLEPEEIKNNNGVITHHIWDLYRG